MECLFVYYRECRVTYHNWRDGTDPKPVRVRINKPGGTPTVDIPVENNAAIIITKESMEYAMMRKAGLFGNFRFHKFKNSKSYFGLNYMHT